MKILSIYSHSRSCARSKSSAPIRGGIFATLAAAAFMLTAASASGGQAAVPAQAQSSDLLSVRAFGAKGDGVTDDLPAFNAAIAAATQTSKSVFVPDGVYHISGPIMMAAGVDLQGQSRKTVLSGNFPDFVIKAIDVDAPQISTFTLQSGGGGILIQETHRALISDIVIPRGVSGPAIQNSGSMLVKIVNCVQTTNGSQINPKGAIPTYGYLGMDGPKYPINSTTLDHFITEGATTCGICSSSKQPGQGYFTIVGGVSEGTSHGYNLSIAGSQAVTIRGLHMEVGHGAGPHGTNNKDWLIQDSVQISISGEYIGNGYIQHSLATRLDSVGIPQLDIDATSSDTYITSSQLEYNNGYVSDLGVNTVITGSTYKSNAFARVGNKADIGRNVLNPNGDMERWTGSPLLPDGYYAYGGASITRVASPHHSGSFAAQISASGTTQYQGMAFDLGGAFADNPIVNGEFVTVGYWLYSATPLTKNPGIFAYSGYALASSLQESAAALPPATWVHFCRSVQVTPKSTLVITPAIKPDGTESIIVDDVEISRGRSCSEAMDYAANQNSQYYISGHRIMSGPSVPTTGSYLAGDIVINSAPSAGVPLLWQATASGTPGTWTAGSAVVPKVVSVTASQGTVTMSGYNTVYICNATAGNVTLVLPDAATASARSYVYVVKKADASANACVVTPQGGDTVDGSNRLALNTYLGASTLMASAPGYWWVVSH